MEKEYFDICYEYIEEINMICDKFNKIIYNKMKNIRYCKNMSKFLNSNINDLIDICNNSDYKDYFNIHNYGILENSIIELNRLIFKDDIIKSDIIECIHNIYWCTNDILKTINYFNKKSIYKRRI